MTTTMTGPVQQSNVWAIGAPRLLAGLDSCSVLDHRAHTSVHGPMPATDMAHLLGFLDSSGIAGRGGAGFDFATKLRALRGARPTVVVNGSESEPASHKDRTLLRRTPHLVLDGALAVAHSVGARRITVAVHDAHAVKAVQQAVRERRDAVDVKVQRVGGGFVAGEARALVRGLQGGPALPPGRHQHVTEFGVLVANPETFAQVAVLLRCGARSFGETGTSDEPGTTLLTIGGAVGRPGIVEIPLGTPLGIVLSAAQAGPAQAVVTGGYHGTWLAPNPMIQLSRAGLASAGGRLGAGVLLVLDQTTCALGELARVTDWLAAQSARQCGPCRFGLPALAGDIDALYRGTDAGLQAAFAHARLVRGRGACSHPDGTAGFVTSGLHLLHDEIDRHLAGGCGRPVRGQLGALSQTGAS